MSDIVERVKKVIVDQLGVKESDAEKITTVQKAVDYIQAHQA